MKQNLKIEEIFNLATQNYQTNNLKVAEDLFKKILKINPNHFEAIFFLGTISAQLKKFDIGLKLLNKTLEIQPNYLHAHINLGNTFRELNKPEEAIKSYLRAIKIDPNSLPTYINLATTFKDLGEYEKSISYYEKVIKIDPNQALANNNLGILYGKLKNFEKAQKFCEKAIQIKPNYSAAHYNLGLVFHGLGKYQKAINCYEKTILIQPDHVDSYNNLGVLFRELGNFKKAISCYENALKYDSENLTYLYQLSDLKKEILNSELRKKINKIITLDNCTKKNLVYGNFLLAKFELKKKKYKKVLDYLIKGHECYFDLNVEKFNKAVDYCLNELPKINERIDVNQSNQNIDNTNRKIKPIFIFGLPRSGSTLVEKVIVSGPSSIPTGEELGIFGNLVENEIHQKQKSKMDLIDFKTKLIESYKKKGLIEKKSNYIFTDKSLDNFFYLNLIHKIFPNAKVIDCKRNALSSVMSILANNLIEISWAHKIEHILEYFDTYYKMMKNYKKTYPNFIYELKYEKFVNDPTGESKKLMKFCNLPWSNKCLEFYKRKDLISKTTSNVQIRKAIYKDSINKYLPYKQFLNKYFKKYSWLNY